MGFKRSGMIVTGIPEIDRALKQLPAVVGKKVIRQALRKGAKVIQAEAKRLAPVKTGRLKKEIKVRSGNRSRKRVNVNVLVDGEKFEGGDFYPAYVEYGTPTAEAHPYMRPAYEKEGANAARIIEKEIAEGIEREVKKLRNG